MTIDLTQFLQTFFEEINEILSEMEQVLLHFNVESPDKEKIDQLFRAVHTIKGNSATFGFSEISAFAHALEGLLDQARSGQYLFRQPDIDFLLEATDCIQGMVTDLQNKEAIRTAPSQILLEKLRKIIDAPASTPIALPNTTPATAKDLEGWDILFRPGPDILRAGTEPYRLFRILEDMGKLTVTADISHLPDFHAFNPEECYLSWRLQLTQTHAKEAEISEIFEWASSTLELNIHGYGLENPVSTLSPSPVSEEHNDSLRDSHVLENKPRSEEKTGSGGLDTIRVSVDKIDALINIVGELVITELILEQATRNMDDTTNAHLSQSLLEAITRLNQNCRELQESVMRIRMVPISVAFHRLQRVVRDIATKIGKQVELHVVGEQTELDKTMMEKLIDPLTHLIRNAIDHGIETPEVRISKGKSPFGVINLMAYQQGGNVIIIVNDDGAGINTEKIIKKAKAMHLMNDQDILTEEKILDYIFQPGFSTAEVTTDISGRGVGLDVVHENIHALHGTVAIQSNPNQGTRFTITLPLTLAIMDCQLFRVAGQTYIVPLVSITEIIKVDAQYLHQLEQTTTLYYLRGAYIPLIDLRKIVSSLNEATDLTQIAAKFLIIATINDKLVGLIVDDIASQQQVVIKSLESNYQKITGILGATVLGDGSVALIIDIDGIAALERVRSLPVSHVVVAENNNVLPEPAHVIAEDTQLLIFKVNNREYGVDMRSVVEIGRFSSITPLPNTPSFIMGVINLRGLIIPVVNLWDRLEPGGSTIHHHDANPTIIILKLTEKNKDMMISMMVDSVTDTYYVKENNIEPPPEHEASPAGKYIAGLVTIDNRMIIALDLNRMDFII